MQNAISNSFSQSRIATQGREFSAVMASAIWRHRYIHAVALAEFTLAVAVGLSTDNLPDFGVLEDYGFYIVCALWIGCSGFAIFRLGWLAIVDRNPSPSRAFFTSFSHFFADQDRIANSINGLAAMIVFISGFSVLKGAIAILSPFKWDLTLSHLDRALLFGHAPYELLGWLLKARLILFAINFAYNFWFVILIALIFTACLAQRDKIIRHQYLMSFMLIWLIAGFFVAMGFSSAGPCYFAKLGLGSDYQPLMDALGAANRDFPIWAVSTQDMLWNGYISNKLDSIGISAFPSLHVANAVLFSLYATSRWGRSGALMWGFAGIILVGSVVLGWHYAVDGYAGALLSLLIWKSVGYWMRHFGPNELAD